MAQQYIKGGKGVQPKDFTTGTGAPTIASGDIALTFDPASLTRGDVEVFLERLEQWIPSHSFPVA